MYPKRVEGDREREKKILVPNFVHTRPGQENFEKNRKKIQKIKKPLSVRTQPEQETSKKNCKKIQKIKKINSGSISIQNGLSEAEKER